MHRSARRLLALACRRLLPTTLHFITFVAREGSLCKKIFPSQKFLIIFFSRSRRLRVFEKKNCELGLPYGSPGARRHTGTMVPKFAATATPRDLARKHDHDLEHRATPIYRISRFSDSRASPSETCPYFPDVHTRTRYNRVSIKSIPYHEVHDTTCASQS